MKPPQETSGWRCEINLIGLSLLLEIFARQALPPPNMSLQRITCLLLLLLMLDCSVSVTTIYRLSAEMLSVFGREKYVTQIVCGFLHRCVHVSVHMPVYKCVHLCNPAICCSKYVIHQSSPCTFSKNQTFMFSINEHHKHGDIPTCTYIMSRYYSAITISVFSPSLSFVTPT